MRSLKALAVMLLIGLVRLLHPLITVRFGTLFASRLGHLAGNTECYLCERDAMINRPKRSIDIWSPRGEPANEYLFRMFARVMWIDRSGWAALINDIGSSLKGWQAHQFNDSQWGRDIHNLMEKMPAHLTFTRAEERRGRRELRALGIPEGAKWVCIIARDPIYLKAKEPAADYSYHGFRDSDVNHYRQAALSLMERGYYVVRMGVFVDGPMKLTAPMFIDYAVSGKRSDFLDVYLGAKCAFCISNGTGFDGIPMIFRRPICYVNESPFEYLSTWQKDSLAIWKHHYMNGQRLQPAEIIERGAGLFAKSEQYESAQIRLIENSDDEIRDVALEMANRLEGKPPCEPDLEPMDDALQRAFWKSYPRSVSPHNSIALHGEIRLRIGAKFLRQYE